jgi:hypothetical protein
MPPTPSTQWPHDGPDEIPVGTAYSAVGMTESTTPPSWDPDGVSPSPARPRHVPVADLFEETIRIYRRTFVVMLGFSAIVQLPILLASVPVFALQGEWFRRFSGPTFVMDPQIVWGFFGATILIVVVSTVLGAFGGAAMVYIAGRARLGDRPSFGEVFQALGRLALRILGYLGVWVLGGLLATIGLFVLFFIVIFVATLMAPDSGLGVFWGLVSAVAIVVAVVVVLIRLALSLPVLVLEQVTAIGSLRRSWMLVKGRTLRTLGIFLVAAVAIGVVSSLTGLFYPADMFEGMLSGNMGTYVLLVLISWAVNALVGPVLPTLLTLLYYDYAGLSPASPQTQEPITGG